MSDTGSKKLPRHSPLSDTKVSNLLDIDFKWHRGSNFQDTGSITSYILINLYDLKDLLSITSCTAPKVIWISADGADAKVWYVYCICLVLVPGIYIQYFASTPSTVNITGSIFMLTFVSFLGQCMTSEQQKGFKWEMVSRSSNSRQRIIGLTYTELWTKLDYWPNKYIQDY